MDQEAQKQLLMFAEWIQSKDEKAASIPTEQLAGRIAQIISSQNGELGELQPLWEEFQKEMSMTNMFKNGGKLDYLVKLAHKQRQ